MFARKVHPIDLMVVGETRTMVPKQLEDEWDRELCKWVTRYGACTVNTVQLVNMRFMRKSVFQSIRVRFPHSVDVTFSNDVRDLIIKDVNGKFQYKFRTFEANGAY